jgi:hypothetical protein
VANLSYFFIGTSDIILEQYVDMCLQDGITPSAINFWEWANMVEQNKAFTMLVDLIFTYGLSIFLFRAGVRKNNSVMLMSARMQYSPMFHITHSPNYCSIELRDNLIRELAPPPVKNLLTKHESHSQSGHVNKHEGLDYVLEAYNKGTKNVKPPGVPTFKQWENICRNLLH